MDLMSMKAFIARRVVAILAPTPSSARD